MKYIQVGSRKIGVGQPCFIIAEASSNHGGSLIRAKKLIEIAKETGADAVKFQVFSSKTSVADYDHPLTMVKANEHPELVQKDTRLQDLFENIELPRNWLPKLAEYSRRLGIIFFATPADVAAVDQLESVKVSLYKIGSYEMQDVNLLRKVAKTGKPIIMSTGMATMIEIGASIKVLRQAGAKQIMLLHCRSTYPLPPDQADLLIIQTLKHKFNLPVGWSDHTLGIGVAVAAVALGAKIIEKHFKLDDGVQTIDDQFSLDPQELTRMVQAIRQAEAARGRTRKIITPSERKERKGRRSLWVIKPIKQGEKITEKNLMILQPALGLSPLWWDKVMGKKAKRNLAVNTPLQRKDFETNV